MEDRKRRFREIDALYALGILLVLIGHSHSSDGSYGNTVLHDAVTFIYTFHMPLFFAISGFLFFNSGSFERKGFFRWIGDKAVRLLIPYVFWTLIGLVPKYYFEHKGFGGLSVGYVLKTLYVPQQNVWGHFWFLPVLFCIYLIFGLWKLLFNRIRKPAAVISATVVLGIAIYFIPVETQIMGLSDICPSIVWFASGIAACFIFKSEKGGAIIRSVFKKKIVLILYAVAAAVLTAFIAEPAHHVKILGLLTGFVMILACAAVASFIKGLRAVRWMSLHNFTIYIFSWLFQSVVMTLCDHFRMNWIVTFFAMFAAGIAGPLLVIVIFEHIRPLNKKWIRVLIGAR